MELGTWKSNVSKLIVRIFITFSPRMGKIESLYTAGKTVFTTDDVRILWNESDPNALKSSIKYFADKKRLLRLRKGLYALSKEYDALEVAQKLIAPSYISLDTALQKHGIIFQSAGEITCFALYSRRLRVDGRGYAYHTMSENILLNPIGVMREKNYSIASPERAVADFIHLRGESYFDNLRQINPDKLDSISAIYPKESTKRHIKNLIKTL